MTAVTKSILPNQFLVGLCKKFQYGIVVLSVIKTLGLVQDTSGVTKCINTFVINITCYANNAINGPFVLKTKISMPWHIAVVQREQIKVYV